jgi:pimeloyl-ACP methyl ester carboxylesterase
VTPTHAERRGDDGVELRTIEVEGRSVSYLSAGPADGPPLLLVHGGLGDAALHFERIVPLLAARYRVIAPDLPRFGDTAPLPDASFDRLADWLVSLADALALGRVVLVGNSFGAGLSRVLAARHPERVRGLVLLGGGLVAVLADAAERLRPQRSTQGDRRRARAHE